MNKKVTTTRTNLKLLGRRKQQGNTLVPVVIGLGIAAVATVAFLNQGEDLVADNNRNIATSEIAAILNDYNTVRAAGTAAANVTNDQVTGLIAENIYGNNNEWAVPIFSYSTDSALTCTRLLATFNNTAGVDAAASICNAGNPEQLDLTLN